MEGNILKLLRKETGKSQEQVAKELGYHTTTYARWEQDLHNMKLIDVINIAKYYNVSLDYIAGLEEGSKKLFNDNEKDSYITVKQENNQTAIGIINYNDRKG